MDETSEKLIGEIRQNIICANRDPDEDLQGEEYEAYILRHIRAGSYSLVSAELLMDRDLVKQYQNRLRIAEARESAAAKE